MNSSRQISYKCSSCQTRYENVRDYNSHIMQQHLFNCVLCKASFHVQVNLEMHKSVHYEYPVTCPGNRCFKVFSRFASFNGHIQKHFVEEKFSCEFCIKSFSDKWKIDEHLRCEHDFQNSLTSSKTKLLAKEPSKEKKKKEYICENCNKHFIKQSLLVRHLRIHNGDRPYKCDLCSMTFTQKNSLEMHKLIHTGHKPHKCAKCNSRFIQKGNLEVHMKRVHSTLTNAEQISFPCNQCSCVFKKLRTLNAHISRAHKYNSGAEETIDQTINNTLREIAYIAKAPCINSSSYNNANANNTDDLNPLLGSNPDYCTQIQMNTPNVDNQTRSTKLVAQIENGEVVHKSFNYILINNVKWFTCETCPKRFLKPSDLIRHFRVHTKEKAFACTSCGKCFSVKSSLQIHLRKHKIVNISNTVHKSKFSNEQYSEIKKPLKRTETGLVELPDKIKSTQIGPSRERPFSCTECTAFFKKTSHLKQHLLDHQKIKLHKCKECNKLFSTAGALNLHTKLHTGIKLYSCTKCSKKFSTLGGLNRHKDSTHSDCKNYVCPYCEKQFKSLNSCTVHIKLHVPKPNEDLNESIVVPLTDIEDPDADLQTEHEKYTQIANDITCDNNEMDSNKVLGSEVITCIPIQADSLLSFLNSKSMGSNVNNCILIIEDQNIPSSSNSNSINENVNNSNIIAMDNGLAEAYDSNYSFHIANDGMDSSYDVTNTQHILNQATKFVNLSEISNNFEIPNMTIHGNQYHVISADENYTIMKIGTTESLANMALMDEVSNNLNAVSAQDQNTVIPEANEDNENNNDETSVRDFDTDAIEESRPNNEEKKIHACMKCSKKYSKPIDLRRHERKHTGERPFHCGSCDKTFSLKSTLKRHEKIHIKTDTDYLICHVCSKKFASQTSLRLHMRIHTGAKPFKCPYCPATFRTSGHKIYHMQAHENSTNLPSIRSKGTKVRKQKLQNVISQLISPANADPIQLDKT